MAGQRFLVPGLLAGFIGFTASTGVLAQGSSQGRGNQGQSSASVSASVRVEIGRRDREIITSYYTTRAASLPPGLAKRGGDLPPGLEKQLEKNGQLPPGLEKKLEPLPPALERQLTKLPDGYTRFALGAHLVIMNGKANVVADFLLDVVR